MGLNAITNDATLRVMEWGGDTLRAAVAGETAYLGTVNVSSQSVVDANGPAHTKIVANDFTAMSAAEILATDLVFPTAPQTNAMIDAIVQPNIGWGALQTSGSGSGIGSISFFSATSFDSTSANNDDPDGRYFESGTSGSINSDAGIILNKFPFRGNDNYAAIQKIKLQTIADVRFWACILLSTSESVMLSADVPVLAYVGVRFSTSVPDTNFQFMSSDASGTNTVDSGVPVTTDVFHFRHTSDRDAGSYTTEILDKFGNVLASHTHTTNIPNLTSPLGMLGGVSALAASAKQMRTYYAAGVNRAPTP